jgi:hypothetical protein
MKKVLFYTGLLLLPSFFLSSCASFKSNISGSYQQSPVFSKKSHVNVLFDLYHYKKDVGLDVIPKLLYAPGVLGFSDIFKESLKNLTNISNYESFTNRSTDVDDLKRRLKRDSCIAKADYTVRIEILRQKSFARHFLGIIASSVTATIFPIGYKWNYSVNVLITNKKGETVGKYERSASVTTWYELLLFPLYPFHTEEKQNEELYLDMLSDIFKQVENENILK